MTGWPPETDTPAVAGVVLSISMTPHSTIPFSRLKDIAVPPIADAPAGKIGSPARRRWRSCSAILDPLGGALWLPFVTETKGYVHDKSLRRLRGAGWFRP